MAYYLTIKEKNNYKLLDITNLEEFKRISKFKNTSYSLDEIDMFTSQFESELSLKRKLFDYGVITLEEILKDITIRIKLNGKLKKVPYGLAYKHITKYLDYQYLRMELLGLQNDKTFLNKLLDYYRDSHKQEGLRQINALLNGYRGTDINMFSALDLFFKDEVFSIDYSSGITKLKYKSLHDLAMFIYNYLYNRNKSGIEIETKKLERINELTALKESLTPKQVSTKKRTRKIREELDGQTSFF